jgi:hypothetical protein
VYYKIYKPQSCLPTTPLFTLIQNFHRSLFTSRFHAIKSHRNVLFSRSQIRAADVIACNNENSVCACAVVRGDNRAAPDGEIQTGNLIDTSGGGLFKRFSLRRPSFKTTSRGKSPPSSAGTRLVTVSTPFSRQSTCGRVASGVAAD